MLSSLGGQREGGDASAQLRADGRRGVLRVHEREHEGGGRGQRAEADAPYADQSLPLLRGRGITSSSSSPLGHRRVAGGQEAGRAREEEEPREEACGGGDLRGGDGSGDWREQLREGQDPRRDVRVPGEAVPPDHGDGEGAESAVRREGGGGGGQVPAGGRDGWGGWRG